MVGGVCLNTGTIPSKTLREAVLYLTGLNQREMYGQSYRVKEDITVADLTARTQHVVGREIDVVRSQLSRNHVTLLAGTGRFVDDAHRGRARTATGSERAGHRRAHRDRHRHPARPARRPSSSTSAPSSTPTASSTWSGCRARWSSSAPA